MAVPSLPAQGSPSWFAWAQGLHNEVATGRLSDTELRAAYGPSQFDTVQGASLARTSRISEPATQMPAATWATANPTGMDHYGMLANSGGTPVLASPLPARLVNATPANCQIDTTFWTIKNVSNGSATPGPLAIEFTVTTDKVVLNCNPLGDGALSQDGRVRVWVDNIPFTVPPGPSNGAHTPSNLTLTWPSKGTHRLLVAFTLVSPNDIWISTGDTIAATTSSGGPRLFVLGDSWVEGALNISTSLAHLLPRYLGIDEAAVAGQGGTGYVNGSATPDPSQGKSYYGSTDRRSALVANNPTDVVILGSINDDPYAASTIQAAAAALYSYLATNLPAARLHVVLPQPTNPTSLASAGHIANREAVRSAAQAASNVTSITDPSDWLTGTGTATARTGDGNRDLYLGSDGTHPTLAGHYYLGRRLAEVLSRWLYP